MKKVFIPIILISVSLIWFFNKQEYVLSSNINKEKPESSLDYAKKIDSKQDHEIEGTKDGNHESKELNDNNILIKANCELNNQKNNIDSILKKISYKHKEIIDVEKLHFEYQGTPARFTWSLEYSPEGRKKEIIQFYTLDEEELPIPQETPNKFSKLTWNKIKSLIKTNTFHSEEGYLENTNTTFVRENGKITDFKSNSIYCDNGECKCL